MVEGNVIAVVNPYRMKWEAKYSKWAPLAIKHLTKEFKNQIKDAILTTAFKLRHLEMTGQLLEAITKAEEKKFLKNSSPLVRLLVSGDMICYSDSIRKARRRGILQKA